jgi:hypothetical protein
MRRRLFNFATVLSLVLLIVATVLWVRSIRYRDLIEYTYLPAKPYTSCEYFLQSDRGEFWFSWMQFYEPEGPAPDLGFESRAEEITWPAHRRWPWFGSGFELYYEPPPRVLGDGNLVSQGGVGCPYWFAVVILLLLPSVYLRRRASLARRRRSGLCQHCGYNLTGNVSGVCSECGSKVTHETSASE